MFDDGPRTRHKVRGKERQGTLNRTDNARLQSALFHVIERVRTDHGPTAIGPHRLHARSLHFTHTSIAKNHAVSNSRDLHRDRVIGRARELRDSPLLRKLTKMTVATRLWHKPTSALPRRSHYPATICERASRVVESCFMAWMYV